MKMDEYIDGGNSTSKILESYPFVQHMVCKCLLPMPPRKQGLWAY
jgi:hypothetical protein